MKSRFGSKTKIVHLIYTCSTPAPQKFQRTLTSLLQRGHETSQLHNGPYVMFMVVTSERL